MSCVQPFGSINTKQQTQTTQEATQVRHLPTCSNHNSWQTQVQEVYVRYSGQLNLTLLQYRSTIICAAEAIGNLSGGWKGGGGGLGGGGLDNAQLHESLPQSGLTSKSFQG